MNIGVVGSSVIDIFALSKAFRVRKNDRDVQITLSPSTYIALDNAVNEPGGEGLLAAIVFARQGHHTRLLTRIANDLFGQALRAVAAEETITLIGNTHATLSHSDTCVRLTATGKRQTILQYTGSFLHLDKSDIDQLPVDLHWLHVATLPSERSTLSLLLKQAESQGIPMSINPHNIQSLSVQAALKILQRCSVVILSHGEAVMLLGKYCPKADAVRLLYEAGLHHVVIYGDDEDSVVAREGVLYRASPKSAIRPIDKSGSESVFAAAYAQAIATSADVGDALTHAITQATSVATIVGCRAAILTHPVLQPLQISRQTMA